VRKKSIKNSQPFVRKMRNVRTPQGGGIFFDLHCTSRPTSTLFEFLEITRYILTYLLTYLIIYNRNSSAIMPSTQTRYKDKCLQGEVRDVFNKQFRSTGVT